MKDIKGYEGRYAITRNGRVWSYKRIIVKKDKYGNLRKFHWPGKWLKTHTTKDGGWYYSIAFGRKHRKGFKLHRLIAQAYIPNPHNLPEINHKNGKKWDNRISNLEWCNRRYNLKHGYKISPSKNRKKRFNEKEIMAIRAKHLDNRAGYKETAIKCGVSVSTIGEIVRRDIYKYF